MTQHEHLPPAGYVQTLPVIEHGDREAPEGTEVATIGASAFSNVIRAMNLIREDNGGPSWPPESEPVIAARWLPYLDRIEAAIGALADDKPAPEDEDGLREAATDAEAGKPFCYLNGELYTFCNGECTAMEAIAARSADLALASKFLNDFFEGWSSYEDEGFDPTIEDHPHG